MSDAGIAWRAIPKSWMTCRDVKQKQPNPPGSLPTSSWLIMAHRISLLISMQRCLPVTRAEVTRFCQLKVLRSSCDVDLYIISLSKVSVKRFSTPQARFVTAFVIKPRPSPGFRI
jgi:hypothetical protein